MGGKAFDKSYPNLPTPRLTPDQYRTIRNGLVTTLYRHFRRVAVPIEGPGKTSYGDVDILIAGPRSGMLSGFDAPATDTTVDSTIETNRAMDATLDAPAETNKMAFSMVKDDLVSLLQPTARIGSTFALPMASLLGCQPGHQPEYVQVDITVLPTHRLDWHYFMHSHGDTWNMLSPSLRRVGLVMTDVGLCVLNPLIAPHDRKRGRLTLTNSPDATLHFLGLKPVVFWGKDLRTGGADSDKTIPCPPAGRGFESEAELFAYIASSRFFDSSAYQTTDLKSAERQRTKRREAYARFVQDFIPTVRSRSSPLTYDESVEEALDHFKKRDEYVEMERAWKREQVLLNWKRHAKEMKIHALEQDIAYADVWISYSEK